MKFLLVMALVVSFHAPAFAGGGSVDSMKISRIVDSLSKWVYGVEEIKVKGNSYEEMLSYLAKQDEIEDFVIENYPRRLPNVDDGGSELGLITLKQAKGMFIGLRNTETELTTKQEQALQNMFGGLQSAGAVFGYEGFGGGSVCGVTWPSVLVLDSKVKKIYRFIFVGGPC